VPLPVERCVSLREQEHRCFGWDSVDLPGCCRLIGRRVRNPPVAQEGSRQGMFRALHAPAYRRYVTANVVSQIGTWMQRIGQDWLVLQISDGSGVALGLTTALQFGPSILSMVGGVLADRYDKRRLLMGTQSCMALLALTLGVLVATNLVVLWHVLLLAALLGVVSALDVPVRQSFLPEMVGPALLTNAVGLNSTMFNAARLIGPALAGSLIAASGGDTSPAFFFNALSFGFTLVALAGMRKDHLYPSSPVGRGRGQLRAGLAYAWGRPDLRLAMALALVLGTFTYNFQVAIALMARLEFGVGAGAFGWLSTAYALGSIAGALLSARRSSRPRPAFLAGAAIVFGCLVLLAGLMPTYLTFAALLVPTGAASLAFSVANNSYVQLGVDPQMRGRVMALYMMCLLGGTTMGSLAVGWLSERLGVPSALVLGGAVIVVAGLLASLWARRLDTRAAAGESPRVP
jgi:MFS family permease